MTVLSAFEVKERAGGGSVEANSITGTQISSEIAAVSIAATSASFRIPGSTDVPSDSTAHRVGIASLPLTAKVTYQSTPKLLPAAFLNAAVTNGPDYPLLDGPIAAFLDGMFVAKATLKTVMPGEKFNLAFGADEGIRVERKLINRFTKDVGLLTGQVRVTYDSLITVTNDKSTPVTIMVTDQVPLSRHEKIKVEQLEPDPDDVKPNDQGLLTWTLELKPGEKRELPVKFSVTYPKDFSVTGLE